MDSGKKEMKFHLCVFSVAIVVIILSMGITSAIRISVDREEYQTGENIIISVYTTRETIVQLIGEKVIWETTINKSGKISIPTSDLPEGKYSIYASDGENDALLEISIKEFNPYVNITFVSKIEGNLTISGKTNIPDGNILRIEVDDAVEDVRVENNSFSVRFDLDEGIYNVRVLFGDQILSESKVYVESFRIRSIKVQPAIYVGEPIRLNVSTNSKGFEVKVTLYSDSGYEYEVKEKKYIESFSGEVVIKNTWVERGDYNLLILVSHEMASDILKIPIKIKDSFIKASVESSEDGAVRVLIEAPENHTIWILTGSNIKKIKMGSSRHDYVEIQAEGNKILVIDQMNLKDDEFNQLIQTNQIDEIPHVLLDLSLNASVKSGNSEDGKELKYQMGNESTNNINVSDTGSEVNESGGLVSEESDLNVFAAIITILVVGGILAGFVYMVRGR
jgi:hypothetical protein